MNSQSTLGIGSLKRRVFRKTENSSFKLLKKDYDLKNGILLQRQKALSSIDNQTSSQRLRIKSVSSSKELFRKAKSNSKSQTFLKQKHHSKFQIPTASRVLSLNNNFSKMNTKSIKMQGSPKYQSIDRNSDNKKHLQNILAKKLFKEENNFSEKSHFIKQSAFNTIDSQQTIKNTELHIFAQKNNNKNSLNSGVKGDKHQKIQQAFSFKFNLYPNKQSRDNNSLRELISEYVQTQQFSVNDLPIKQFQNRKFQTQKSDQFQAQINIKSSKGQISSNANVMLSQQLNSHVKQIKNNDAQLKNEKNNKPHLKQNIKKQIKSEFQDTQIQPLKKGIPQITNKKPKKVKKETYFEKESSQVNYESFDDLEDIVLSPQSKVQQKPRKNSLMKQNQQDLKNKEQNLRKQHTHNLEQNEQKIREKVNQINEPKRKINTSEAINIKNEQIQTKQSVERQLIKANEIIDKMTPVGEVAGYCSQMLKKIKLKWHLPAVLLYKECYHIFKKYETIYIKAYERGILTKEEKERYFSDNETIKNNLQKIVQMTRKKGKVDQQAEHLITCGPELSLEIPIQTSVLEFAKQVQQSSEKNNQKVLQCLLRMINGVLILGNLRGHRNIKCINNIDAIKPSDLKETVQKKLMQINKKNLKF